MRNNTTSNELRLAATLMIMAEDQSVLMVRRNENIDFAGGAFVFPGGKLGECDNIENWRGFCQSIEISCEESAARIAAVRETFEETGILFAKNRTGNWVLNNYNHNLGVRYRISKQPELFLEFAKSENLILQPQALAPIAIWCPPKHIEKRFMTWFFVAIAPIELFPIADNSEAMEAIWIKPNTALADARNRQKKIIFPTRCNLALLGAFADNHKLLEFGNSRPAPIINPELCEINGQNMLCIPQNIGYPHWCEPIKFAMN